MLTWHSGNINGSKWLKEFFELTPLSTSEQTKIKNEVQNGVKNIIYANLMSGVIHALVVFLMMILFGVNNIFLLTILTLFIGILPISPSEFGYIIPLAIIFNSNPLIAVLLAIFAELVILFVNYVITPKIIASSQEINQTLILTSILSGIGIFGIMGFIIGPLIMLLIQTLFEILKKNQNLQT
ncbi:AI-2E family transporter [Candidatus Gracilibacteria bacterium]|nr:AI-2E family transporter [Candidatus Gracilibacteria bacterium]